MTNQNESQVDRSDPSTTSGGAELMSQRVQLTVIPVPEASAPGSPGNTISEILPDVTTTTQTSAPASAMQNAVQFPPPDPKTMSQVNAADLEKGQVDIPATEHYKYFVKRFNFKMALSTFACTFVITYMSYVNIMARNTSRIHYAHGVLYNVLMLVAFMALVCHAGCGLISSRGAVLCSDPDIIKENRYTTNDFKIALNHCEHLSFTGTLLLASAVLGLVFYVFEDISYPTIILGLSILGFALVFSGKYRKMSRLYVDPAPVMELLTWRRPAQDTSHGGPATGRPNGTIEVVT